MDSSQWKVSPLWHSCLLQAQTIDQSPYAAPLLRCIWPHILVLVGAYFQIFCKGCNCFCLSISVPVFIRFVGCSLHQALTFSQASPLLFLSHLICSCYKGALIFRGFSLQSYLNYFITLFSHVGWFHIPRICQLHYVGSLNKVRTFIYYSYFSVNIWKFGEGVILPTLFTKIIVHSGTFHMKHCLSRYYSQEN